MKKKDAFLLTHTHTRIVLMNCKYPSSTEVSLEENHLQMSNYKMNEVFRDSKKELSFSTTTVKKYVSHPAVYIL